MPAHALAIANILNNIQDGVTYVMEAEFTAPDARVLVVDDITANLKVMEGLLSPYEMQVTLCKRGADAVGLASSQKFDLVFMDHMMPDMDGIEASKLIRSNSGEYFENLPIVALTANAVTGVREKFIEAGMNDFLAKPIETVKLNAILERWLPREKRRKPVERGVSKTAGNLTLTDALMNISELSLEKALTMVGGSKESYERILKLAVRLLPENIEDLNTAIN
jgi:CheY-like chemotaxis protein